MSAKHTPTPWRVDEDGLLCSGQLMIGEFYESDFSTSEDRANAAFIVKAVNSHEALVEAVRQLLVNSEGDGKSYRDCHKKGVAALKLAEAE